MAGEFIKRFPGFFASEQNVSRMNLAVQELTDAGHSFSTDTLSAAYHRLNALGALEEAGPEVEEWRIKHYG